MQNFVVKYVHEIMSDQKLTETVNLMNKDT